VFGSRSLTVKIAGGSTAQVLGLMSGIYASRKLKIPFKIKYYPYSTGTYWPCILEQFLEENEILNLTTPTRGLKAGQGLEIGKIISSHPLLKKRISFERIIRSLRSTKILPVLEMLRREKALHAQPIRLIKLKSFYLTISGGFPNLNDEAVNKEMHRRFLKAGIESPFEKKFSETYTVIHFRIGDKRAIPWIPSEFTGEPGIIDPKLIADLVCQLNLKERIFVVSDEPEFAKQLLSDVGISAQTRNNKGDIWEDINFMAKANIFIGSHSTVSRLVNIFVENNGGHSYLINVEPNLKYDKFPNTTYLKGKFLPFDHRAYKLDFILPKSSHSSYKAVPPSNSVE